MYIFLEENNVFHIDDLRVRYIADVGPIKLHLVFLYEQYTDDLTTRTLLFSFLGLISRDLFELIHCLVR